MGGGNINKKKSWDPSRRPNQEKVWKPERQAIEERKRIQEKQKEIAESRRAQELQSLQDAARGTTEAPKVDWMYAPAATQTVNISPEMEMYLLGTKKASKAVSGKPSGKEESGQLERETSPRNTTDSIRQDPFLGIKKRELEEPSPGKLVFERNSRHDRTDTRYKHNTKRMRAERDENERSGRARRHNSDRKRNRSHLGRDLKY